MRVSTKGRYALRMMIDLAQCERDQYVSLRDVAERQEVSVKYMEQIVGLLARAGLLYSTRGPLGGYRLARLPEEYTAGDILRATEGSFTPALGLAGESLPLQEDDGLTRSFWEGLHETIQVYVDSVTLADLVLRQEMLMK